MSKSFSRDYSSLDVRNSILQPKEDNLSIALSELGIPYHVIHRYLLTRDDSYLFNYSRAPGYVKQLHELMESSKSYLHLTMNVPQKNPPSRRIRNEHENMQRDNDHILQCSEELRHQYMDSKNILKVALLPSSELKIHGVEDLHVPVVLKKSEISPDLPQMTDIHSNDFFKRPNVTKKRILLFGPPGVGKTTEIKMWLYCWCHNKEGPLKDFRVVFYIDGAKLEPGTSLGDAIMSQCLSPNSKFSPEDIERMCQERHDDVLVILDNYTKWRKKEQLTGASSLDNMVLLRTFPFLTLLVATTSGGVGHFREVYGNYDHVKAEGISEKSVFTYVHQVFKNRKEFGKKVEKCLHETNQVSDMAASPVLLSIMCQMVKWYENPTVLGDLKTGSALIDTFIKCIIKHAGEDPGSEIRQRSYSPRNLSSTQTEENIDRTEVDQGECSLATSLRERTSCAGTASMRTQLHSSGKALSTEDTIAQLSAVAFHCYLKEGQPEELHLSEDDFLVCGDLKAEVIREGCRLGLLVRSCGEEFNPSSPKAAKGKVIRFLRAPFQQRLAAKHLAKLLQGKDEEMQSFHTSLEKISSIDVALSLRNLLLFACEESVDTARLVISHVVELTQTYAEDMYPDAGKDDVVLRQAQGLYQYMIEFILDLNYAAKGEDRLNDILRPLVTRLRILSPTVVMTRALAYLLKHTATPNKLKLDDVDIEVFDVPREIMKNLPQLKHISYHYEESAQVKIEMSAFVDSSVLGASSPGEPLSSISMRKLSIKVTPQNTKAKRSTMGAQFPVLPAGTQQDKITPFTEDEALPFRDNQGQHSAVDGSLPVTVSAGHDRGVVSDGRARRVIPVIDRKCIVEGDFIDEGRFGEVYKATYDGKEYAMKRIKNVAPGDASSVTREIKMNERVSHPNIVVLHAYSTYQPGKKSGYRFELLMDYIEGQTLEKSIFEEKLPYLETPKGQIELALKVSDAIAHMHANKCTHSDIKPNNILIKLPENEPFVCDLGSGHVVTQSAMSMITSGKRYGVQRWMPPESSGQGCKASYEGDVWSLACILVEVFTRRKMWESFETDKQLIARLSENEVVPEQLLSDIKDESIKNVLRRCFTRNMKDRPLASELVSTFQEALRLI